MTPNQTVNQTVKCAKVRSQTEEQKMELEVDLRCIPEWEAELKSLHESIHNCFRLLSLPEIVSAVAVIREIRDELDIDGHVMWIIGQSGFEQWAKDLTVDRLAIFGVEFTADELLLSDEAGGQIIEMIRSALKRSEDAYKEYTANGITGSLLVSMFTSKGHVDSARALEHYMTWRLALSHKIPKFEAARRLLGKVHSQSSEYNTRVAEIEAKLALAKDQRGPQLSTSKQKLLA